MMCGIKGCYMKYFEFDDGDFIIAVGKRYGQKEITKERYDSIISCLRNKPDDTETYVYMLNTSLVWVAIPVGGEK